MTLKRSSQLALASAMSLLAAGLLTACGTLTVDFVFVTSAKASGANNYGLIDVFEVNSESGRMKHIPTSPFPSGGRNPVAEATSPDNTSLYVVNEDDNTIVQFAIGNDGKVYPQNTTNTPGIFPLAVSVGGNLLFEASTYQQLPSCSPASPCSGAIGVFPIKTGNVLGDALTNASINANYWPLSLPSSTGDILTPTGITAAASGAYVYVSAVDSTSSAGYVFSFAVNADGTLTPLNGGAPFAAGKHPSAIAANSGGSVVYVTDSTSNGVFAFSSNAGILTPIGGSPFPSGNGPDAIVVDASGNYVFVANALDSNLTAYSSSGGALASLGTYATGTQPSAIGIDPSLNQYLYTANFLGSSVTGFQINGSTGALLNSQGSPYGANANPTAVAAIPHGAVQNEH
ncbi:MAG TPA: beta-propeller fold lactonase family protein [Terracidiphilus sp.]|jgi:6-phosphogluconolactonase|nr:beta-propeller fold lactonase family protein [Terracidiphilus sp.]